jgi:hypothetical protein
MRKQSVRFLHFYRDWQLAAISGWANGPSEDAAIFLIEAAAWLIEGAFCQYYSPEQVQIAWVDFRPVLQDVLTEPSSKMAVGKYKYLTNRVENALNDELPFRTTRQMQEGIERNLEQLYFPPLFRLATEFRRDVLSQACVKLLRSGHDSFWDDLELPRVIDADGVSKWLDATDAHLSQPAGAGHVDMRVKLEVMTAGFVRVLRHMTFSMTVFEEAKRRYQRVRADFEAFQERVGLLRSAELEFDSPQFSRRFGILQNHFENVFRGETGKYFPEIPWSDAERRLSTGVELVKASWEENHSVARGKLLVG